MSAKVYNAAVAAVPMPERIKRLPVSDKGFPVPAFVAWIDGAPDFRVIAPGKVADAWKRKRCWICGDVLGVNLAMTIGPMCAVNRTISEPPSHRECSVFAATACPFLANPRMKRNERDLPDHKDMPGIGLKRNPGAVAVWITREVTPFRVDNGVLFRMGDPSELLWFSEGRKATRAEVVGSIESGLPFLMTEAQREGERAVEALEIAMRRVVQYLPAA